MAMMRFVDMMYSIPDMLYVIMIVVVMGPSMSSILIGICISSWMGMARQVRAQVMTLKEQEFSLAAKVLGAGTGRIIFQASDYQQYGADHRICHNAGSKCDIL